MVKTKGVIYKITNPNGRIYIGKSTNIKNRFRSYKNLTCKTQPVLYNSLLKYGFNNHTIEIIGEFDEDVLSEKEIYYIELFNSFRDGMNCTKGGDNGVMSGDDNISKRLDVRKKMSDSKLEYYKNNVSMLKGISRTEEVKEKIRERRFKQKNLKGLIVLDLETGIYYINIKELSISVNNNNIDDMKFYKHFHHKFMKGVYKNKYIMC